MNLREKTKSLLRKYQISPKRHLGQNFIVDPSAFHHMVDGASVNSDDKVLDIGAGLGFLTHFLAKKCKKVLAVESDPRLVKVLRERLRGLSNVKIIPGDVLQAKIPSFNKVVSAPPYYLSSSLIPWLFHKKIQCAVLILQEEFVNRLVAPIGDDNYGWLTVITAYHAEIEPLMEISQEVFFPQPKVDSLLIQLTLKKSPPFPLKDESIFTNFVQTLFTQRNRKVRNGILPYIKRHNIVPEEKAVNLADSLPFHNKRIRKLTPKEFGKLANALPE